MYIYRTERECKGGDITRKSLQTRVHALYKLIKSNATFANKFRMNVACIKYKTHTHTCTPYKRTKNIYKGEVGTL